MCSKRSPMTAPGCGSTTNLWSTTGSRARYHIDRCCHCPGSASASRTGPGVSGSNISTIGGTASLQLKWTMPGAVTQTVVHRPIFDPRLRARRTAQPPRILPRRASGLSQASRCGHPAGIHPPMVGGGHLLDDRPRTGKTWTTVTTYRSRKPTRWVDATTHPSMPAAHVGPHNGGNPKRPSLTITTTPRGR